MSFFYSQGFAKNRYMFHVSGIGRPPGKMDTANYVLRQFNKQEQEEV